MNANFCTDFFKLAIKPHSLNEKFRIRTSLKDVTYWKFPSFPVQL